MIDPFNYTRRNSSVVRIGDTPLGGDNPIRLQSMTNTSTLDTEGSIEQIIRIADAGGEYARLTAQGVREAENLRNIRDGLRKRGYPTPLVADIHFNPNVADVAATIVEKVRINPGNYAPDLDKIRQRFLPFLAICREQGTAIRIGVNHGSLSERIMSRYGDTPEGMVESCMEFLRLCIAEGFTDVVLSIKASNTLVMVQTVRLLVATMNREGMAFPLHLGVTEAGEGEDGRIRSALGIGALLIDGIGDTIRVSLSEEPEKEIPVAKLLRDHALERQHAPLIQAVPVEGYNSLSPSSRETYAVGKIGGDQLPVVVADYSQGDAPDDFGETTPDYIYIASNKEFPRKENQSYIIDYPAFTGLPHTYPLFSSGEIEDWKRFEGGMHFLRLCYNELTPEILSSLREKQDAVLIIASDSPNRVGEARAFLHRLMREGIRNPAMLHFSYKTEAIDVFRIYSATDSGSFFLDRQADGILLSNPIRKPKDAVLCSFSILQASGRRITRNEYISCPGCGRTLFDLQTTVRRVKEATAHLKGLKIAVMGCIVNGPGEMADADFGYVGAGAGKVSLYRQKECVKKNIPEEEAVEELLRLIKKYQ